MEAPPQESSQVPPIATTPPHPGLKEELLSQSSSGTQISITSGVSLGEAIRRRSLMNREMEAWYLPSAETDNSNLIVTVGWRVGQTQGGCNRTEFPTMEEGLVTPTVNSRRHQASGMSHSPLLEIQDSQLSPNLPLLATYATQGQTFFNETLFQQTELDFAPLRGTPDFSVAASERPSTHLQISEAVQLATGEIGPECSRECFSLSQHPLAFSIMAQNSASLGSYLSQHPLSFSEQVAVEQRNYSDWQMPHVDMNAKTLDSKEESSGMPCSQMWPNQQLATQHLPKESWGTAPSQDMFLLDNSVPAPVLLELLEEEMGLSKHDGFLSSESSSCKSALGKDPEENVISQLMKNVDLSESVPKLFAELRQPKGKTTPKSESSEPLSDPAGKLFRNAGDSERISANISPMLVSSRGPQLGLGDSCMVTEISPTPVPNSQHTQQNFKSVSEEEKSKFGPAPADSKFHAPAPFQPITLAAEEKNAMRETLTSVNKSELTPSDWSVESEHRSARISLINEGSFFVHLAHPIHHSTPGFFTPRSVNCEGPGGAFPAKSVLQAPLSCLREEMSKASYASAWASSVEEPCVPSAEDFGVFPAKENFTFHRGQGLKNENSNGSAVLQPLKGRIQSMPSLNFMEKVGAWNVSRSAEKLSDALALRGSDGISPRQRAYSAIADSLSCILSKQQSLADLKARPAASFCGPGSMTNLHSHDNKSPQALPFTRSQSETSMAATSRESSRAERGNETRQKDTLKQAEVNSDVSRASRIKQTDVTEEDSLGQHYKATPITAVSSDEESVGTERHSGRLIASKRVAQLLKEEASSLSGSSKEESGGSEENPRELPGRCFHPEKIGMDYFRDLSPDNLNRVTDSRTGSYPDLRMSSGLSSGSSSGFGKLQSSLEDELRTPSHGELNIEERIPVYLHNLGIDQSPSSILTPFMPQGPIREIEFSPTELRTLKASTDLFHLHLSEEDSQSVKDAVQSTLNSSLLSGPALAGSAVVSDASLPTEPSPQPSRDGDPLHQSNAHWKSRAVAPPLAEPIPKFPPTPVSTEENQVIPGVPSNFGKERSTKYVEPEDSLDSDKLGVSQGKPSSGSLSQDNVEKCVSEEIRPSDAIPAGERGDSFTGSNTPKESQKLVAEVDPRTSSGEFRSTPSISSSGSLKHINRRDLSGAPGSVKRSKLGIQRVWSWDESMAKQNIAGSLKWEDLQIADSCSKEPIVPEQLRSGSSKVNEEHGMTKPVMRSEPEGCNMIAVNKSLPISIGRSADSKVCPSPDLKEIQAVSNMEPLDGVSNILGNFQQVEERTNETHNKGIGSAHESANSSSVDSLGVKVKKLLQYEHSVGHRAPWMEMKEPDGSGQKQHSVATSAAFSREDVGAQGSDNSSSLDSLAHRVKTLLEEERPVMHAAQILRSVEEEEEKARAWVKLKLTAQPQDSVPDLNEEDRWMIEQIKREQRLCSGKNEHLENQRWGSSLRRFSNYNPTAKLDSGLSKSPRDTEQQKALKTDSLQLAEFSKENAVCGTDGVLTGEQEIKPLNSVQSHVSSQLQSPPVNALGSRADFQVPLDTHLTELKGASKAPVRGDIMSAQLDLAESGMSVEAAKQITSITFASRRRSPSPASQVPWAGLAEADSRDPVSLEAQPVSQREQKRDRLQLESCKACNSASLASPHVPEKSVGFSSLRVGPLPVSVTATGDESHQESAAASVEKSPGSGVGQKDLVTESREEKQGSSLLLAERGKYDKPMDHVYGNRSNPERTVTLANQPPQKTGEVLSQDGSVVGVGSFGHTPKPLFPEGRESMLARKGRCTSGSYSSKAGSLLLSSSPDHISTALPASPSSPARKALSGVHITLSPRQVNLGLPVPADIEPEGREVEGFRAAVKPATPDAPSPFLEDASKLKPTDLKPKTQESSYFPKEASLQDVPGGAKPAPQQSQESRGSREHVPVPAQANARAQSSNRLSLGDNLTTTASSQTERMSSDAITQITTESPEKTTYSAEIFVSAENGEASHPKSHKIPSNTIHSIPKISILNRQDDQPLVLPYKPPGCSEVYYVPCPKETLRLSRVQSGTTMESSHSGSNDAVPPDFPPQALGSRDDDSPDAAIVKHREGIYSKKAAPKTVWMEEKIAMTGGPRDSISAQNSLESLKTTHSVFGPPQFSLQHPAPLQDDPDSLPGSRVLGQDTASRGSAPSSRDLFQHRGILESPPSPPPPLRLAKRADSFTLLNGEVDYSFLEELKINEASKKDLPDAKKPGFEIVSELPPGSQLTSVKEKQAADPPGGQSAHLTSRLDDLWAQYLERQKQHQHLNPGGGGGSRTELSLVERLDRLARLLQNPVRHSLALALGEQSSSQKAPKRREPGITSSRDKKLAAGKEMALQPSLGVAEETPVAPRSAWQSRSRCQNPGGAVGRNGEQSQTSEALSDTSSEMRPARDSSVLTDVTSESEVAQVETESATQTEASGSASTINTARLIRAFGHDRVQASPKLSQLYNNINLQKSRSEDWGGRSKKAKGAGCPRPVRAEQKGKDVQASTAFMSSDSVSSISSHGPSPALSSKRMLNKAIQAGDFEIVNSATKKHTRDVGLTFPTPTSSQATLQGGARSRTEDALAQRGGLPAEDRDQQKRQPGSFLAERRPRRSQWQWMQGVSWFVPVADLKRDPQEEAGADAGFLPSPAPLWSASPPRRKPWREPLREKNWPEHHGGLQASLAMHRPDFISSSGERVKRLKLLMEERKLQSMLQGEREELFNPPDVRSYRNTSGLSNRDYRTIRKRAISKNEMVERSKRIYEQLPEVRKRREEEKRRSDYSTNRLKAQLYKTKITNRVLGRKVPWE
ncbi:centrosome-associated protein ALMS1 [Candoia aspera]|uniref:centrosome-associated protein ALMS1 n=1 Tax=Candoia aspera TaxID=51853 RepID=UPI002FD863C2